MLSDDDGPTNTSVDVYQKTMDINAREPCSVVVTRFQRCWHLAAVQL
jgi:hypothetical protein